MKRYPACILATVCIPWRDDFSFAEDIFRRQVRLLRERLTPYLYIFGTAAEGHAVSERQFDEICRVFREETAVPGVHGMVGLISLSLATVIERIERAYAMGFREFQISLPSWGALTDDEVALFFRETCGRFPDCQFLHYNLLRTGRLITPPEYGRLAEEYPNLVATKNSTDQMIRIRGLLTLSPQIRHFITETGYAYACQVGECGLLISMSSVNPEMGKAYFEAGQRRDVQTLLDMQGELMALGADMRTLVDARVHMDGGFDKLYCKLHDPDFPLRLLPPYRSSSDAEFGNFREMIRRKYPRWAVADLTPGTDTGNPHPIRPAVPARNPDSLVTEARFEAARLVLHPESATQEAVLFARPEFAVDVAPGVALRFVRIPSSYYTDGCTAALWDSILAVPNRSGDIHHWRDLIEVGRHDRVVVPYAFFMSDTIVTNAMFAAFANDVDYETSVLRHRTGWVVDPLARWRQGESNDWRRQVHPLSEPEHPVVQVSWFDAMRFAAWLGRRAGVMLRLPTKEEWMLAARPEALRDECCLFPWGNSLDAPDRRMNFGTRELADYTWIHEQFADGHAFTSPVRAFPPNARGLHDMTGNVWVWNWTNHTAYEARARGERVTRPCSLTELGVADNARMTMQGGCYLARLTHANLLAPMCHPALDGAEDIGFRLVAVRRCEGGF